VRNALAALHQLVGQPLIGPAELGKRLNITSASTTVLVDRLEQAGYVRRERDPNDRRRIVLVVTETTATRSLAAVRPLADAVASITNKLDQPTRRAVADYLGEVTEVMRAFIEDKSATQRATQNPNKPSD
jgi:DNA-binding MarR family transcriptional regulator